MRQLMFLACLAAIGCATVNNTVDKSRTVSNDGRTSKAIAGIAIPAIPENAAAEGLSRDLTLALPEALRAEFPGTRVVDPAAFGAALRNRKGYLEHFARWRSVYEQTGVMDSDPLVYYAKAVGGVSHLLIVRSTDLDREKVSIKDALRTAPCRRVFCTSSDSNNIWETRLKVLAELVDVRSGAVAWRGVGEAVRIQQGSPRLDFGLFIVDRSKGHDVETLAKTMVEIAAKGLAKQIQGEQRLASGD